MCTVLPNSNLICVCNCYKSQLNACVRLGFIVLNTPLCTIPVVSSTFGYLRIDLLFLYDLGTCLTNVVADCIIFLLLCYSEI
ncbi:hypothetical protein FKM82_008031 [Ascaphus truei]